MERLLRQLPDASRIERAPALELLVHARVARGELDEARSALEKLRASEKLFGTAALRAAADRAEGALAAARGDNDSARQLLEDAVDGYERCGAPYEAAEARMQLATSLIALDRVESAHREARAALDRFAELGAEVEALRARRMLSTGLPIPLRELTQREREVLALIAEGLTNKSIAAHLVVSERTVHRHVTNILRKLDIPSRTAAAAIALRAGLPPTSGASSS